MTERSHRFTLDKKTMYQDGHRVLTMTSQCDGVSLQDQDALRERIVQLLNEEPPHGWTCFHCGEHFPATFVGQRDARAHFGEHPGEEPGCVMQLGPEDRSVLARLRRAEGELDRYRQEDSDKDREMAALRSDHAQALIREEEKGYTKGVRDARAEGADVVKARDLRNSEAVGALKWLR